MTPDDEDLDEHGLASNTRKTIAQDENEPTVGTLPPASQSGKFLTPDQIEKLAMMR